MVWRFNRRHALLAAEIAANRLPGRGFAAVGWEKQNRCPSATSLFEPPSRDREAIMPETAVQRDLSADGPGEQAGFADCSSGLFPPDPPPGPDRQKIGD
jgi:hypothetical protein